MNGVQRVLSFCCFLAIVPAFLLILPLYLRHHLFADVIYPVAESDIIEIHEGISPLFCESHSLEIQNGTFSAFQLSGTPKMSEKRKHIRLKKSMSLPDDTLEYWGFYLMKGATVQLKVCSRYDGSRLLVVKGERNLQTCGLLNHTKNRVNPHFNKAHKHVKVTFEDVAELINKYDFEEEETKTIDKLKTNKNNIDVQNDASEQTSSEEVLMLKKYAEDYIDKHVNNSLSSTSTNTTSKTTITTITSTTTTITESYSIKTDNNNSDTNNRNIIFNSNRNNNNDNDKDKDIESIVINENKINNVKKRQRRHHHRINNNNNNNIHRKLTKSHNSNTNNNNTNNDPINNNLRIKRNIVYDRKVTHGGNAKNYSKTSASNSVSSFENELLNCYDGQILLAESFRPSLQCTNVKFLEESNRMITTHEVVSDGYYYYIFYSDNDYVQNDIHAVFNIYKPTFQYSRMPETKGCINGTNCTFPISMWSNENVIIEMPTRDGLAHDDEDDQTLIISKCHPRMAIYMIFPISVLVLILTCAFL